MRIPGEQDRTLQNEEKNKKSFFFSFLLIYI